MNYFLTVLSILIMSISVQSQQTITLQEIWRDGKFQTKGVPGFKFLKDGKHYTRLENNQIVKYDITTGKKIDILLDLIELKELSNFTGNLSSYDFNEKEDKLILRSDRQSIYRRSSEEFIHIYDFTTGSLTSVFDDDKIMNATFSPDASKVAYVWKNDLYYFDIASGITLPVTDDGKKNAIINGSTDWVYEEEFSIVKAFWWSPDSKKIAYIKFDETEVKEFTMTYHEGELYPRYETFKYPKVGEKNSKISVHFYHLKNEKTVDADLGDMEDVYVPRVKWTKDPNKLCVFKMNRHQNHLQLFAVDAQSGSFKIIMEEKNKYYIDITDDLTFLKNGREFIWTSEKSGYNHIYLYNMNGQEVRAITSGDYDVTQFYGINETRGELFYQAAEKSPMQREIYKINISGKRKKCLSKEIGVNSARFSSTLDYHTLNYSNVNTAPVYTVRDKNGKLLRTLEENNQIQPLQSANNTQPVEFFSFNTSEGVKLNGWMLKPPNFNANNQYPVFMFLYGGPGSQQVMDSWRGTNYWWFQMLAQQGYVVACVDNRGTGARGEEFKKSTYLQLGKKETEDQIEAAKYLGSLSYTDATRIGIFGWSYGGYMSSLCLFKGNDVFKAAIAVAPVTNWKWYDTIYTERYMRTEKENEEGYAENSPVYFADKLKGNYLLVHGSTDDNVHFQNSMEMAAALIRANKQYDTYTYPGRNHGIYGDNARLHLYTKMTNFLNTKLKGGELENNGETIVNRP